MKQRVFHLAISLLALVAFAACSDDDKKTPGGEPDKTYAVGDFYNVAGVKGVVYWLADTAGKHGMILSLDETTLAWATESAAFVTTGATTDDSGAKNMAAVMKLDDWKTNYPAFAWCDAMNTGEVRGWVLPAIEQLDEVHTAYSKSLTILNKTLTDNGGKPFDAALETLIYWSSTENFMFSGVDTAAFLKFDPVTGSYELKINAHRVRAVREF